MSAEPTAESPVDPRAIPPRPMGTTVGVVMVWIGSAVLIYASYIFLGLDENSSTFKKGGALEGHQDLLTTYHSSGLLALAIVAVLVPSSLLVFLGYRWGGTVICVMAGFTVYWLILSLFGGFAPEAITVTVWSISAASLCRTRPPTKEWFKAVQAARKFRQQAD